MSLIPGPAPPGDGIATVLTRTAGFTYNGRSQSSGD